jgi:prepilin-type N-terminal cleavage/methylation domain-containing protein
MKKSSAFTLIELLIVICIIGILAAAIILNFSGARERQQLSILADKSVAMLQVAQQDVRSGKYDSVAGQYFCEGAHFVEEEEPLFVTMPYDTTTGACDFGAVTEEDYGLATAPAVVETITVGSGDVEELYALYLPPDADFVFYDASETAQSGDGLITFTSGGGTEPYSISLNLSALTGIAALTLTE